MSRRIGVLVVVFWLLAAAMGCAGESESDRPPEVAASTLPRTTSQSITITLTERVEIIGREACHSFGESGWGPHPDGCEVEVMVHEYSAQLGDEIVTTTCHDTVTSIPCTQCSSSIRADRRRVARRSDSPSSRLRGPLDRLDRRGGGPSDAHGSCGGAGRSRCRPHRRGPLRRRTHPGSLPTRRCPPRRHHLPMHPRIRCPHTLHNYHRRQ